MTTSADVPSVDCVYKLQEYAGLPRRKRSDRKATWPGRKQVWRRYDADGRMMGDTLGLDAAASDRAANGEPLLQLVMRDGRRLAPSPPLDAVRAHAKKQLACLPEALRHLGSDAAYPVTVASELIELAAAVDRQMDRNQAQRDAGRVAP
jgi:nicotinate phosphoribosyltransferase